MTDYADYADIHDNMKNIFITDYADIHDNMKNSFITDYADIQDNMKNSSITEFADYLVFYTSREIISSLTTLTTAILETT